MAGLNQQCSALLLPPEAGAAHCLRRALSTCQWRMRSAIRAAAVEITLAMEQQQ
jgi:hypothetical protein